MRTDPGAGRSIARAAQRTALASRALAGASEDLAAAERSGEAIMLAESAEQLAGMALAIEQLGAAGA